MLYICTLKINLIMEVKKCYTCKIEKGLKYFSKNKSKHDGLNTQCKCCHSKYRREKYKEDAVKEKEQTTKYRQDNSIDTSCSHCGVPLKRYRTNVGEGKHNFCNFSCTNNFYGRISEPIKKYLYDSKKGLLKLI